jgi:outer membrane protein assembly factor BamA
MAIKAAFASPWIRLALVAAFVCSHATFAQVSTVALTQVKVEGSEPPDFSGWSNCVRNLGGEAYDEPMAKACLHSILATNYFTGGQIETDPYSEGEIRVVFHLDAPSLVLSQLKIGVPEDEKARLIKWLARDRRTLRPGDVYQREREFATWYGIDKFYRAEGKHVGISETLRLNYQDKTAGLSYKIFEGPFMSPERMLPPYGPPCKEIVGILNLTGLDDYVPTSLVEDLTRTQAFSCFSRKTLSHDESVLENSGLFRKVQYRMTGPPNYREVYLTIAGRPLKVKEVSIYRYGEAISTAPPGLNKLKAKVGSVYSRANAAADKSYLKRIYSKPGETVQVFENEEPLPGNLLRVKYSVLAYDATQFFVDGKRIVPTASEN